ncbi:hypothetical protein F1D05_36635 [Kribbella qitaiheensis]|uniref:Uncharacterized protein n=1 Tax=Kribbella qitaiheensis TaxID=1544730 RepID=A0A7G6X855_9ACTN|nr:hypothetical protein [Kribbella qitaiheensis]QNE22420.1 hypothetical protein F1D05_36635 [Kribbella qitaiheensis]
MTPLMWSPLGQLLDWLSLLPQWVRPWVFAALLMALIWALVRRSLVKRVAKISLRIGLAAVSALAALVLGVEFVDTRRRRARGQQPRPLCISVGAFAESTAFWAGSAAERVNQMTCAKRRWPSKTLAAVSGVGLLCWLILASSPALAAPTAVGGKAYDLWRQVERWADVDPDRITELTIDPAPVMQLRGSDVVLATSKSHKARKAVIWLAEGGKPLAAVMLDANGTAVVHVTNANRGSLARGRIFRVEYGRTMVYLRMI